MEIPYMYFSFCKRGLASPCPGGKQLDHLVDEQLAKINEKKI